ncbi:MAG: NADH-quinone oxidoreductase subunit J [Chloroflexi bacterium]|nr:NADH-quinone oxidoreductase subunit J [Chloroflexota bacterium]
MTLVVFYLLAAVTLLGAMGVVVTRNVVYAALALLLSLMGVAGIYLLLFAEFLALVQVLIYGGAITVVILFAIMLTRLREYKGVMENPQWPLGLLAATALFLVLVAAFLVDSPRMNVEERLAVPFLLLGGSLFSQWAIAFEVASLVLLVALIGAIIVARGEDSRERP